MQTSQMNVQAHEMPRARLGPLVRLSVAQYHRMLEAAILREGEPVELLDGLLVRIDRSGSLEQNVTVSPLHRLVVSLLMRIAPAVESTGSHLQLQSPITIIPSHEPEPDALIVRGSPEDYADRHPGPEDVSCVIEVADSSLTRDRTTKYRIYAGAGIPQYIIVNLVDRVLEVHERPDPTCQRYESSLTLTPVDKILAYAGSGHRIEIDGGQLLPA